MARSSQASTAYSQSNRRRLLQIQGQKKVDSKPRFNEDVDEEVKSIRQEAVYMGRKLNKRNVMSKNPSLRKFDQLSGATGQTIRSSVFSQSQQFKKIPTVSDKFSAKHSQAATAVSSKKYGALARSGKMRMPRRSTAKPAKEEEPQTVVPRDAKAYNRYEVVDDDMKVKDEIEDLEEISPDEA